MKELIQAEGVLVLLPSSLRVQACLKCSLKLFWLFVN